MNRVIIHLHTSTGFLFLAFNLVIMTFFLPSRTHGGNEMKQSLYEVNDLTKAISLEPRVFKSSSRNLSLFSVPQDNSVGTNDIGNAITVISFPKDRISYAKYFKNAINDIGGGGVYIPVIAPDVIGFGQVRSFVIYDFKLKLHREFRISMSIGTNIEKIAIADAQRRHFVFDLERQTQIDYTDYLQLVDLSGEKPKIIKEMDIGNETAWTATPDKLFLYNLKTEQLQVLNMKLESTNHPLADLIRHNKGNIDFTWIHPHPYLPFAILSGGKKAESFINWGEGRDKVAHTLFNGGTQFSFSPDGKWVVFKYEDYSKDTTKTYVMPVSEKYPHYLGSPILLSKETFGENNRTWTTNPVSFVGSSLDKIYRWDLTNQPHPGSDKVSFHDYIVEQDLEKLAKEKRQGLGGSVRQ